MIKKNEHSTRKLNFTIQVFAPVEFRGIKTTHTHTHNKYTVNTDYGIHLSHLFLAHLLKYTHISFVWNKVLDFIVRRFHHTFSNSD